VRAHFGGREEERYEEDDGWDPGSVPVAGMTPVERQKLAAVEKMSSQSPIPVLAKDQEELEKQDVDIQTTRMILEDILYVGRKRKTDPVSSVLQALRMDRLLDAARRERARRAQHGFVHPFPWIHRMVKSVSFELGIGMIMGLNSLVIGAQTSVSGTEDETEVYDILEHVFTLVFIVEVALRIMSDGWVWCFNVINSWDVALIVLTGVVPMWILKPLNVDSSEMRLFSVVRILRMIKLVRMVRMVPMFQILYHLVIGLLGSMRLLLFTYLLMGIILYILAVFSVSWVGRSLDFRDDELAQDYFHSVPAALFTLLQVLTCDWSWMARSLQGRPRSYVVVLVCVVVVMVVTLVMLNLVTAVICNSALDRAKDDQEIEARKKRDMIMAEIKELRDLFVELDADRSGTLSKDEYMHAAQMNKRVQLKFQVLGIAEGEVEEIWDLLAAGREEVSVEAFTETMRFMQGDALAKDTFTIVQRIHRTNLRLEKMARRMDGLLAEAKVLQDRALEVHKEAGSAMAELHQLAGNLAWCIPQRSAQRSEEAILEFMDRIKEEAIALW